MRHISSQSLPLLILLLTVFGILFLKVELLTLPHYWDDLWVYGPAIVEMSENLSLLPDAIKLELGRGHPLFFHFIGGSWVYLFGDSLSSQHLFAFFIYCLLGLSFFWVLQKLGVNAILSSIGALLVYTHPYIFAQATLVLPEIALALANIFLIYGLYKRDTKILIASSIVCVLTKETGAFLVFLGITYLVCFDLIRTKKLSKAALLSAISSVSVFGLFLFFNWLEYGWLFYPEHLSLTTESSLLTRKGVQVAVTNIFLTNSAYLVTYGYLILILFIPRFKWWKKGLTFLLTILAFKFFRGTMKIDIWQDILGLIGTLSAIILVNLQTVKYRIKQNDPFLFFLGYFIVLLIIYTIFFAVNFSSLRYLTLLFPPAILLIVFLVRRIDYKSYLAPSLLSLVLIPFVLGIINDTRLLDVSNMWPKEVECRQNAISTIGELDCETVVTDFLTYHAIHIEHSGYKLNSCCDNKQIILNQSSESSPSECYVLVEKIDSAGSCVVNIETTQ